MDHSPFVHQGPDPNHDQPFRFALALGNVHRCDPLLTSAPSAHPLPGPALFDHPDRPRASDAGLPLPGWWTWATVFYAFAGAIPLLELLIPADKYNLSKEEGTACRRPFDRLLHAIVPIQWGILILFCSKWIGPVLPLGKWPGGS